MIEERYCNFETSKLLTEKGMFLDYELWERSYDIYGPDGKVYHISRIGAYQSYVQDSPDYRPKECYPIVTQAVAIKWLRECKNLYISVVPSKGYNHIYYADIHYVNPTEGIRWHRQWSYKDSDKGFDTPEEAIDNALLYILKDLI